jgi:hypothetical protein
VLQKPQLALWLFDVGNTFLTKPRAESAVILTGEAARKLRFASDNVLSDENLRAEARSKKTSNNRHRTKIWQNMHGSLRCMSGNRNRDKVGDGIPSRRTSQAAMCCKAAAVDC